MSGPGDASVEGLPRSNTCTLDPTESALLERLERADVDLAVYFEDAGTRGSTDILGIRSGTGTYSENGYLAAVYDQSVDGEYVHLETLPAGPD